MKYQIQSDPLAPVNIQFALAGSSAPHASPASDESARPWGLRHCRTIAHPGGTPDWQYDHNQQIGVDSVGRPMLEVMRGDPSANTTTKVDGQDPPSSEDWHND